MCECIYAQIQYELLCLSAYRIECFKRTGDKMWAFHTAAIILLILVMKRCCYLKAVCQEWIGSLIPGQRTTICITNGFKNRRLEGTTQIPNGLSSPALPVTVSHAFEIVSRIAYSICFCIYEYLWCTVTSWRLWETNKIQTHKNTIQRRHKTSWNCGLSFQSTEVWATERLVYFFHKRFLLYG